MLQDFRYAVRNLRRTPLFAAVALFSLALGIGANCAIFTVADQVLLRSLPVAHARDLVFFTSPGPQSGMVWGENLFSNPMFRDFLKYNGISEQNALANIGARFATPLNLSYQNRSERVRAELVSGTWFDTLGLKTSLGRGLTPDDDRTPGGHSVVVLTNDFWKSRFNGDASILNKVVRLNGHPMTVVGVTAPGYRGFDLGSRTDALVPIMMKAQMTPTWNGLDDRRVIWLQLVGRLKPGVTPAQARAGLETYYRGMLRMESDAIPFRSQATRQRFNSKPLIMQPAAMGVSDFRDQVSRPLLILFSIVGLLLLIACANVANLLLARAVGRQKEIAVRLAVGASRYRLVRQLVVESVVLALGGGALGILVAAWTVGGLLSLLAGADSLGLTPALDWRVFAFATLLALVTGIVFGLIPALQATAPSLSSVLKDQAGNVSAGGGHVRLRKVLVASQVTISLVMLIGATLFARSLRNLENVDLGFQRERLVQFSVDPSLNSYSPEQILDFTEKLQERLSGVRGIRNAAVGENAVIGDNQNMSTIRVEGYQARDDENMNPLFDSVSPGYFATLGIPLQLGRDFTMRDRVGAPKVAIVNDVFAKYFFKDGSPIGRRFGVARAKTADIEIVGVVRGSHYSSVDEKIPRVVYLPMLQNENPSTLMVYARTTGDPKQMFTAIRREVQLLDANLPITGFRTMEEQVGEALSSQRLMATLSVWFALLATALAAIGLYGVMAYTVSRRTREIGIRLALGAGRGNLLRLVMRETAILTVVGIALAIPVALALTGLVREQLYGILPNDPGSIVIATAAMAIVAMIAGYIPAERATRVNPIAALRHE